VAENTTLKCGHHADWLICFCRWHNGGPSPEKNDEEYNESTDETEMLPGRRGQKRPLGTVNVGHVENIGTPTLAVRHPKAKGTSHSRHLGKVVI
jgi:hypothetical protein